MIRLLTVSLVTGVALGIGFSIPIAFVLWKLWPVKPIQEYKFKEEVK